MCIRLKRGKQSLQGGVTLVQVREKHCDTAEFIHIASETKAVCDRYKVPVIINDRVDVAIIVKARGVHLGQTDMPVSIARSLLPSGSIIGVSCNNVEHIRAAVHDKVDYVGIGAVWGTQTKQLTNPIIGVRGVGAMLEALDGTGVKAVGIGGIKATNALRTLHGCVSRTNHALDGIAVVSDIVASPEPGVAAERLAKVTREFKSGFSEQLSEMTKPSLQSAVSLDSILEGVARLMTVVREKSPLVHQITNTVVATQSANVTLAVGGSPIMATEPREMEDLGRICNALLINIGTMRSEAKESMLIAGRSANANRRPVVFDPVGVGASAFRKDTVRELLNAWQASVIKGNPGELATIAGSNEVESKGVDSVGPGFKDPVTFVRTLARKERCIVVMTGATDYISDGETVVALRNGDELLGRITGSGCVLGSCIATYSAVASSLDDGTGSHVLVHGDMFMGAIAGVLVLTVAAEIAASRDDVKGPGTFLPALIDELWSLSTEKVRSTARIEVHVPSS